MKQSHFEVIDQHNGRHRFNRKDGYFWQWRPASGTTDVDDFKLIEVMQEDKDGYLRLAISFPYPATVGDVDENTCLQLPMRELQLEKCPRCGFVKPPQAKEMK